jgi:hypothetical protein
MDSSRTEKRQKNNRNKMAGLPETAKQGHSFKFKMQATPLRGLAKRARALATGFILYRSSLPVGLRMAAAAQA